MEVDFEYHVEGGDRRRPMPAAYPSVGRRTSTAVSLHNSVRDNPAKPLSIFGLKKTDVLEADPDSAYENPRQHNPAFRTKNDSVIDAGYVLPSKIAPATVSPASEAFKKEFNTSNGRPALKINTVLDAHQAADMLRDQQTPLAVDFKEAAPWGR